MSSNKSKSQLKKNLFSLTLVQIATYVLPMVSVPIVSRIIGPANYGIINFAAAYITYFTLIISYSFDFSATRKISKDPDNEDNRNLVFSEVFFTQCLLFVFSTIAFIVLLYAVPQLKENIKILTFTYILCLSTLFTQNWLFQAMQDLSKVAIFNLISRLLFTVTILLVVRRSEDFIWQPFLIGTIQTAVAIWSFFWAVRKYRIKFVKTNFRRCWDVLWEERVIFFSLIFVNLYSSTNTVILGFYQNAEQVGYFSAAQRLILIAQSVLVMPLAQAFYPFIGKAFGEGREKGLRVAQKLIPLIIIILGLAAVAMFFLAPLVIKLFYGQKFNSAIIIFQVLSIVPLFFSLNNVLGIQIMLNLGMDKLFFKITAGAGILSVLFNLLLIKRWGFMGTAINWLITEIFLFITMYFLLRQRGLNPINAYYFKFSVLQEYAEPFKQKFLKKKKS